jgi:hypothetical protein
VEVFENHIFLGGDLTSRAVICHSAPADPYNFTAGIRWWSDHSGL